MRTTHPLTADRAALAAAGPQAFALTPDDEREIGNFLIEVDSLPDEDAALRLRIPIDMVPQFRQLMATGR
ncbi:hypothetical protein ACWT_5851 [Actinoplanes sp. SE50]|uniref:hypothetical protein n=1 Tax=unclassified Actinoplanes TaxID=2626549 RepID=UPI00023EBDC7|nr:MULTISPECIES: hypothetical protein [unclassified Actinoplanes]AEV86869.1 hypothetical protein ACPL_5982 [Actinoplanes sp. SE50/110]ATO85266.1 hypothetical protein ACWT_5851 [Actinoplanes sp. SE50]SLM02676.1 hypothetical protein ACSP50_5958 [Actinoplanes sp. SE50/110]